jgi:hypothetical protein
VDHGKHFPGRRGNPLRVGEHLQVGDCHLHPGASS